MTDIETKIEVEAEDFTDDLSDEALDRETNGSLTQNNCGSAGGMTGCTPRS